MATLHQQQAAGALSPAVSEAPQHADALFQTSRDTVNGLEAIAANPAADPTSAAVQVSATDAGSHLIEALNQIDAFRASVRGDPAADQKVADYACSLDLEESVECGINHHKAIPQAATNENAKAQNAQWFSQYGIRPRDVLLARFEGTPKSVAQGSTG